MKGLCLVLIAMHIGLLIQSYATEAGACAHTYKRVLNTDLGALEVARQRDRNADTFALAAIIESAGMLMIAAGASSRLIPSILVVDALALRARHVGLGGCTPYDPKCCTELSCVTTNYTTSMANCREKTIGKAGISSTIKVNWQQRTNYCALPAFYTKDSLAETLCGNLANTPDVASCYRYGCSSENVPRQYYSTRIITINVLVIAVLAMH